MVLVGGISTGVTVLILWLCGRIHPWLAFAAQTVLCYQLLAARSLRDESVKVYRALRDGTLEEARRAVSMIVDGIQTGWTGPALPRRRWRPWPRTPPTA